MNKQSKLISDDRGWLMEILRADDPQMAQGFGQVYATLCYPGKVKGWHRHEKQIDRMACVSGMARIVQIHGDYTSFLVGITKSGVARPADLNFKKMEDVVGPLNPKVIIIPPNVWHAFAAVGPEPCIIINTPSEMYNYEAPDEERLPLDEIPYDWKGLGR